MFIFVSTYVCEHVRVGAHLCQDTNVEEKGQFFRATSPLYHVCPGDGPQVVTLGSSCLLYQRSHLSGPEMLLAKALSPFASPRENHLFFCA